MNSKYLTIIWSLALMACASTAQDRRILGNKREVASAEQIPKELQALLGTYEGSWEFYRINPNNENQIESGQTCTDTLVMQNPEVAENEIVAFSTDSLVCDGKALSFSGKEGFKLKNGKVADRFFTTVVADPVFKPKTIEIVEVPSKLTPTEEVYAYEIPISGYDYEMLGLKGMRNISGVHYGLKRVTVENGIKVDRVSRLTAVKWTALDGTQMEKTFISMIGTHRPKQP